MFPGNYINLLALRRSIIRTSFCRAVWKYVSKNLSIFFIILYPRKYERSDQEDKNTFSKDVH